MRSRAEQSIAPYRSTQSPYACLPQLPSSTTHNCHPPQLRLQGQQHVSLLSCHCYLCFQRPPPYQIPTTLSHILAAYNNSPASSGQGSRHMRGLSTRSQAVPPLHPELTKQQRHNIMSTSMSTSSSGEEHHHKHTSFFFYANELALKNAYAWHNHHARLYVHLLHSVRHFLSSQSAVRLSHPPRLFLLLISISVMQFVCSSSFWRGQRLAWEPWDMLLLLLLLLRICLLLCRLPAAAGCCHGHCAATCQQPTRFQCATACLEEGGCLGKHHDSSCQDCPAYGSQDRKRLWVARAGSMSGQHQPVPATSGLPSVCSPSCPELQCTFLPAFSA